MLFFITDELAVTKNSKDFCNIVGKFRKRLSNTCDIDIRSWYEYLSGCFPRTVPSKILLLGSAHTIMDSYISYEEILVSLKKCKKSKAPGIDGIDYSFYKCLPENWIVYMEDLLNKILTSEIIPTSWGKIITVMLPKKGDLSSVDNYRTICLINCIY